MPQQAPIKKTRRGFLREILFGWFVLTILPIVYVISDYIYPRSKKESSLSNYPVAKLADIPANSFKIFKVNKKPIIVINTQQGQVKAYSLICTHLGCVVEYNQNDHNFKCNCHGSMFDGDGKNIAGPAPRPLAPYRVTLTSSDILISEA